MTIRLVRNLIPLLLLLAACTNSQAGGEPVQVFAAASLSEAFEEIKRQFQEQNPGTEVILNFGGSQALAQQIAQGAAADVFASADLFQMEVAAGADRVDPNDVAPLALNQLAVVFPADNPGGLETLEDLSKPGLRLVMAAPEVPAGRYSLEFLENASEAGFGPGWQTQVLANVVSYEENVRSVLTKVALGEADAGLVYQTDVLGDQADAVRNFVIPPDLNVVAVYPLAPLKDSPRRALAEAFIEFTRSPEGQSILRRYGFIVPE